MRVLLDVCTPVQLGRALVEHEVHTATKMGWGEIESGDLLRAAELAGFDVLIVCDKNLQYQQNLGRPRRLAILELWTNHRPSLERHFLYIQQAAETMQPGEYRSLATPKET